MYSSFEQSHASADLAGLLSYALRPYGCTAEPPPTPNGRQVPSPHYWKSKCGEDIDSSTGLRYHRESSDLQR